MTPGRPASCHAFAQARLGLWSSRLGLPGSGDDGVHVAPVHHDGRPGARQLRGDGEADPLCGAGDEREPSRKINPHQPIMLDRRLFKIGIEEPR